jgi:signal peptidase
MSTRHVSTGHPWRRRVVSILTLLVMIGSLLLAAILVLPTLLGYERYVIVSGSMEPTIPVGSVIYDEVVPVDEIKVHDVITFVPPPEYGIDDPVTHRVVRISTAGKNTSHPGARVFETQGDANEDPDAWQMVLDGPDQARYTRHLPYVGYIYMALQVRWVQLLVIAVPTLGLIIYILVTMWRLSGEGVREERRRQLEAEEREQAGVVP